MLVFCRVTLMIFNVIECDNSSSVIGHLTSSPVLWLAESHSDATTGTVFNIQCWVALSDITALSSSAKGGGGKGHFDNSLHVLWILRPSSHFRHSHQMNPKSDVVLLKERESYQQHVPTLQSDLSSCVPKVDNRPVCSVQWTQAMQLGDTQR